MLKILLVVLAIILVLSYLNRRSRGTVARLRRTGVYPLEGMETDGDVRRLMEMGHKIEAIKVYRAVHHTDLKTAKEAVEKLVPGHRRER